MFIGIRDIRFAKWRFALIGSVIALMTFMVVALSALTSGLENQSISAVTRLPGNQIVMQAPADGATPSLSQSTLDAQMLSTLRADADNPSDVAPLGITTTRLTHGQTSSTAAVFGADPRLMPAAEQGSQPGAGGVLLSADQADELGVGVGAEISVGGVPLTVSGIGEGGDYAHTPVVYTDMDTWRQLSHGDHASAAVLLHGSASAAGTTSMDMSKVTDAVPGYGSEHGSLLAMQLMLLAISALVVGAFFAVWTVQRLRDLAVVRAMGGSRGYLLRDALGQAALVLVAGEAIGAVLAIALVLAVSGIVPVALTVGGVLLPLAAMAVLGALGAMLAVRRVANVDPLVALAS